MRADASKNIIKIVLCLETSGDWLWIREIGRRTGMDHRTVSRLIDKHLSSFVEEQLMEPLPLKMIRLKPNVTSQGIMRYLKVREKIEL